MSARSGPSPPYAEGCEECLQIGSRWVHLGLCLTRGHAEFPDATEAIFAQTWVQTCIVQQPAVRS